MSDFYKGLISGVGLAVIVFSLIIVAHFANKRDKELIEYAEKQMEIEALREEYGNRDPVEFLENPDVRRAADGAAADFERKRNEAVQRFRSRPVD